MKKLSDIIANIEIIYLNRSFYNFCPLQQHDLRLIFWTGNFFGQFFHTDIIWGWISHDSLRNCWSEKFTIIYLIVILSLPGEWLFSFVYGSPPLEGDTNDP